MDFKDKIKDISKKVGSVAQDTYKTVADKSGRLVEEAKLKLKTNDLEADIERSYKEMGESIYEKYKSGEDVGKVFAKQCKEIDKMFKEIQKMDVKVLFLKNLRICESCSDTIGIENKFCPVCGEKQKKVKIVEKTEVPVEKNICPQCNTIHGADVNYCTQCGTKL